MNTLPEHSVTVVYESMFGNTRRIAEAIASGVRDTLRCSVVSIADVGTVDRSTDILIIGAPTHGHGMSRSESRTEATRWALNDRKNLTLEPRTEDGVREWLKTEPDWVRRHAAFDTRADMPRIFTGSAAAAIDRRLARCGSEAIGEPRSFLVDKESHLLPGQLDAARQWGAEIAARVGVRELS